MAHPRFSHSSIHCSLSLAQLQESITLGNPPTSTSSQASSSSLFRIRLDNLERQQCAHPADAMAETPKLLWNPDNVKDVAESVGISSLNDEALKCLTQDVEYRIGQVIVESLRFMRAARRTTLTVNDISLALRALDVEPLYGYDSTRPLRYGEASLGPGQPLFYIEDEEVDFEKLINAPLPMVPRDMGFTGAYTSWLV